MIRLNYVRIKLWIHVRINHESTTIQEKVNEQ